MLGGPGKDLVSINNSKDQDLKGSIPWSDNLRTSTSEPWSKVAASSLAKSGAREGASLVGILRPVSDKPAVAQLRQTTIILFDGRQAWYGRSAANMGSKTPKGEYEGPNGRKRV
jgi:hypothetical protein